MERKRQLLIVAIVALIGLAIVVDVSFAPAPVKINQTYYLDPHLSLCKGGGTFSCTIVLDARNGTLSAVSVTSVQINGTNTQPVTTQKGDQITITATLPSISMVRGLGDVGPSVHPPSVGQVVIEFSDGTTTSGLIGPAGLL